MRAAVEVLNEINARNLQPGELTAEQQAVLAKYGGTGGIKAAFDDRSQDFDPDLEQAVKDLANRTKGGGYLFTKLSMQNAHYTPPDIARAIWEGAIAGGVESGRILEPGAGVGIFAGAIPPQAQGVEMTMIEREPLSAQIASYLYPTDQVRHEDLKDFDAENAFDAAVGNVPFGKTRMMVGRRQYSLDNAVIIKTLQAVRPGGLAFLITTRFTLDSVSWSGRERMAELANLIAAVRLPSNAFAQNAKTEVVTDLLVFRRKQPGKTSLSIPFKNTVREAYEKAAKSKTGTIELAFYVNEAVKARRVRIIGKETLTGTTYGEDGYNVESRLSPEEIAAEVKSFLVSRFKPKQLSASEREKQLNRMVKKFGGDPESMNEEQKMAFMRKIIAEQKVCG